ncbi:MAG: M24 family metallopeptidase [Thermoproteota archaeon]
MRRIFIQSFLNFVSNLRRAMRHRIKKIFENIGQKLDAVLVVNSTEPYIDVNFFYVTDLKRGLFEESIAILYPDYSLDLLTNPLEEESARRGKEIEVTIFKSKTDQTEILKEKLKGARCVGIDMQGLVSSDYEALKLNFPEKKFEDVSEAFGKARLIKDTEEIELLTKAARIASEASESTMRLIHRGTKEVELAAELNYIMQKKGATSASFETIVAFGKNSAEPHYSPSEKRIRKGEFVLTDFGARYMRYCSDITRTFVYGKASKLQREIYDTVLRAREAGLDAIRDGVNGRDVHMAVQNLIDKTKFKGKFIHSLGHSIGLSTHDGARISSTVDITLRDGMTFTIEPGIYIPGYGGVRIEDDILITKRGYKLLSRAPIACL